jgi:hypothetical protein
MQEGVWWETMTLSTPFYRSVGGQQMGWERMCPTEMVNLQCISFGIEEKLRVEMVEGG